MYSVQKQSIKYAVSKPKEWSLMLGANQLQSTVLRVLCSLFQLILEKVLKELWESKYPYPTLTDKWNGSREARTCGDVHLTGSDEDHGTAW